MSWWVRRKHRPPVRMRSSPGVPALSHSVLRESYDVLVGWTLRSAPASMRNQIRLILALLVLSGCKAAEETRMKAIIGAVLMDGAGGPPVTNSVVVTAGDKIRAAGAASTVPIPAEADKIDGSGKFLVPG